MSSLSAHTERPERSRNAKAQARHRAKRKAYIEQVRPYVLLPDAPSLPCQFLVGADRDQAPDCAWRIPRPGRCPTTAAHQNSGAGTREWPTSQRKRGASPHDF